VGRRRSGESSSSGNGKRQWKRSVVTGKQDHTVGAERGLRPGATLRVLAGAGNGDEGVAAGGRLGNAWRARERAAGKRKEVRAGRGRRVGMDPVGGGATVAVEQGPMCARRKKRGKRSGGLACDYQKSSGTSR
jgi:hypothetical protein